MAKKSKIKVPKRVAGVKIPKAVRKGFVRQFVNSSAGKLLIAEALTAALALFAHDQVKGEVGDKLKRTALDVEGALKRNTARLTHAFGEGVRAFRAALAEPGLEAVAASGEDAAMDPATAPKKSQRRTSEVQSPH